MAATKKRPVKKAAKASKAKKPVRRAVKAKKPVSKMKGKRK